MGQLRVRRQPCENQPGGSSAAVGGVLLTVVPRAEGEAVGRTSPRAGKESSLMVNVSLSKAKPTSFHGVKVKCRLHSAPHGSENAASAWTL